MAATPTQDRTTFLEFQARNRRATWRLTAAYVLVVGGSGVVSALGFLANLFLVLFALLFVPAILLLGLGALAMLTPLTRGLSEPLWDAAGFVMDGVGLLPTRLIIGPFPLAVLFALGCTLAVRAVWLAAGVGHTLLAMGARPPAPGDLEESQLVNIVREMSLAAGIPPPQVHLLDGGSANAAVAGLGRSQSHVIVARKLLDDFDREETQGVLAHLVGSIGNGDLRGAAQVHSLLYVLELVIVVVLAPFAKVPRGIARQWLLFPLWAVAKSQAARTERAEALIRILGEHRARFRLDGGNAPVEALGGDYFGRLGSVLIRICPPLMALIALAQAATGFLLLFASLPIGLLWRSRRYLADATAVELTRNPSGLYRALRRLGDAGGTVPGAEPLAHLFIVGPSGTANHTFGEREGLLMGPHPALARRIRRLERMGPRQAPGFS